MRLEIPRDKQMKVEVLMKEMLAFPKLVEEKATI